MKLNSFLSTALIATVAALSFGAQAADADKAPAEQTEKAAPKKVKPHSHMTEKTGIPAPEAMPDKAAPAKDAKRHNHQRDMNLNPCCLQRVPAPRAPAYDFSAV